MVFGSGRDRSPLAGKENAPATSDAANGLSSQAENTGRTRSFSFLGRSKSSDRLKPSDSLRSKESFREQHDQTPPQTVAPKRSFSGKNKLVKKHLQREVDEVLKQAREDIPAVPPVIPSLASTPELQTFGGEGARHSGNRGASMAYNQRIRTGSSSVKNSIDFSPSPYAVPMPPVPGPSPGGDGIDPYARTESMTNRGRYSYASSFVSQVNGPRRVRRRKDPTPFNILVIGASNAGKTSFIDFLRKSCELPVKKQRPMTREGSMLQEQAPPPQTSTSDTFTYHYLETELADGERIGLTIWDSEGLERNIIDLQLRDITTFIEGKFEETFSEENKVIRSPGKILDTHIHCVFLLLDPLQLDLNFAMAKKAFLRNKGGNNSKAGAKPGIPLLETSILDERVDLQVLRALRGKTTVIPVISKADTVTGAHMRTLKRAVWNILKENELNPLDSIDIEVDEEEEDGSEGDSIQFQSRQNSVDGLLDVTNASKPSLTQAPTGLEKPLSVASLGIATNVPNGTSAARAKLETGNDPLPPLPLSILTPDPPGIHHAESEREPGNVGRSFAWGFADPYDEVHCDFVRLKEIILSEWRADLREKSQQVWYENWRTARLRNDRPVRNGYSTSPANLQVPSPGARLTAPRSNPSMGNIRERTPQKQPANPLLSNPVRDVSPSIKSSRGRVAAGFGAPMSPPPAFAPPPPPQAAREFSFAGRERLGSFSSPRTGSPATRPQQLVASSESVTALPSVATDEVGVAV